MAVSDRSEPSPRQVITSPFDSFEEWGEWIEANAAPASRDALTVIAGQPPGPRRRASWEELIALVDAHNTDYRRSHPERA